MGSGADEPFGKVDFSDALHMWDMIGYALVGDWLELRVFTGR